MAILSKGIKRFWSSVLAKKANTLEAVGLLAFFVPSVVDPLIYTLAVLKSNTLNKTDKTFMLRQNWSHHVFNLTIEVVTLMAARPLVGTLFRKSPNVKFYKQISGFMGLMLAKSFVRPLVMLRYVSHINSIGRKDLVTPTSLSLNSPTVQNNMSAVIRQPYYKPTYMPAQPTTYHTPYPLVY